MDDLVAAIADVRERLARGEYSNEDQVSKGVVMRLLQRLGWDVFNPNQVSSEFRIASRKVDYALLHDPFGAVVLIEVKDVGKVSTRGEDQLFDYCLKQGVPLAVLTDGRMWNFYWPAGRGTYEQRRFAVADLMDGETAGCARLLNRYLAFTAVTSGRFEEAARSDYAAYQKQIVAKEQFPSVFESLIQGADSRVVSLFCDQVEERCGIRPDEGEVGGFLRNQFGTATFQHTPPASPMMPPRTREIDTRARQTRPTSKGSASPSFTLFGHTEPCRTDKAVLVGALTGLGERDSSLYERLAPHLAGRSRRFLSRDPNQIYPETSSEGVLRSVEELPGGWWVGTHSSSRRKNRLLEMAREVARLRKSQFTWQMKGKT